MLISVFKRVSQEEIVRVENIGLYESDWIKNDTVYA